MRFLTFFILLCFQVNVFSESITLETAMYSKIFLVNSIVPSSISVELQDKQTGKKITVREALPYFRFFINHQLVSADDSIWIFKEKKERTLKNGGKEFILTFVTRGKNLDGLELHIFQQLFENSTICREKLVLSSSSATFSLNKKEGKLHFVFPQYALRKDNPRAPSFVKEVRIATWGKELVELTPGKTYDDRKFDGGAYFNLAQCHMYHPEVNTFSARDKMFLKGPVTIYSNGNLQWLMEYEHASSDNMGVEKGDETKASSSGISMDGMQGVGGHFTMDSKEADLWFFGLGHVDSSDLHYSSVNLLRGGYLDGEKIEPGRPYETVWFANGFGFFKQEQGMLEMFHHYLIHDICEYDASRKAEFYYNTWGMQRELSSRGQDIRGIFTEERIMKEIAYADQLNVDIFVLDDGWEQSMGTWKPHDTRLPNGLAPIKRELDNRGMKMGIWLSPMGIDKETERYQKNPSWVIKDSRGEPIKAQWGHPAFDFVGPFYTLFVEDCKWLIDQGADFFKWDAINAFYSNLPDLWHGSGDHSPEEIRARYEYLLPLYVVKAMKELCDYHPELVIEIDLTEAERVMVGLAVLQYGKFFWMNNGASGYGDYSTYRAKSMRNIPNHYAGILPLELFTYANYPHNPWPFFAQRYNVNTSLVAGYGFWGNLERMDSAQRARCGHLVAKSKRVLPYIQGEPVKVMGKVSSSPEIYQQVNKAAGAGQVIAFSGQAGYHTVRVPVTGNNVLAVLNHAYAIKSDTLQLNLEFSMPDDTREAFIVPNKGCGVSILHSTAWLDDVRWEKNSLLIKTGAPGTMHIQWKTGKKPTITGKQYHATIRGEKGEYTIDLTWELGGEGFVLE